jgi:hypothetical protein
MPTVINDSEHVDVEATMVGERFLMSPVAFESLTGWTLKPEGLCRGDVCAPIFRTNDVLANGEVDLVGAAPLIGLTAVADAARGIAATSASASERAASMTSLQAPDFTLDDLDGRPVSLHDFERRKVLLLAWSSW